MVEQLTILACPVEIKPARRTVLIKEWIKFFIRPQPAQLFFPQPDSAFRALHWIQPAQFRMHNPGCIGIIHIKGTKP